MSKCLWVVNASPIISLANIEHAHLLPNSCDQMIIPLGRGIIPVHHITPLSSYKPQYEVNPSTDLVPICPNCHAMIHRRKEPFALEDLRDILQRKHVKAGNNRPSEGILQEDLTKT